MHPLNRSQEFKNRLSDSGFVLRYGSAEKRLARGTFCQEPSTRIFVPYFFQMHNQRGFLNMQVVFKRWLMVVAAVGPREMLVRVKSAARSLPLPLCIASKLAPRGDRINSLPNY